MIRQLLFITLFLSAGLFTKAQLYVDGTNINTDTSVQFIEIVHSTYPRVFEVDWVDIGRKIKRTRLTDATGKKLYLESPVELLQLMKKNGWNMIRRDMVFQARPDAAFGGTTLVFLLFEKGR